MRQITHCVNCKPISLRHHFLCRSRSRSCALCRLRARSTRGRWSEVRSRDFRGHITCSAALRAHARVSASRNNEATLGVAKRPSLKVFSWLHHVEQQGHELENPKDIVRAAPPTLYLSMIWLYEPWVKITVKWIRKNSRTWESVSYFWWGLKLPKEGYSSRRKGRSMKRRHWNSSSSYPLIFLPSRDEVNERCFNLQIVQSIP